MRRRCLPSLLGLLLILQPALQAACRKKEPRGPEGGKRPTPGYTPLPIPATPTLRPGEPTPLPVLPE